MDAFDLFLNFPMLEFGPDEVAAQAIDPETAERGVHLFSRNGCLLVKSAFAPEYIRKVRDAFLETYDAYFREGHPDAQLVGDRRIMITVDISGPFNSPQLYANPLIFPIIEALLGTDAIVGSLGSVSSLPGAQNQHTHRDIENIYDQPELQAGIENVLSSMPPYAINVMVPLIELGETCGTTRLYLGSHVMPRTHRRYITLDPHTNIGDCVLMDFRLLHEGRANHSDHVRPIMYVVYYRSWFIDTENYPKHDPIKLSPTEYAKIPERYRRLFSRVFPAR